MKKIIVISLIVLIALGCYLYYIQNIKGNFLEANRNLVLLKEGERK